MQYSPTSKNQRAPAPTAQPPGAPARTAADGRPPAPEKRAGAHWKSYARPAIGVLLFGLALWTLYSALHQSSYQEISLALRELPATSIALAAALTVVSYLGLTLYDQLGFLFIANPLPWRRIALGSFIGYALGNAACNAMAGGAAVRYWIYTSFGIPAREITKVVVFCSAGFWLGYIALGAAIFSLRPLPAPALLHLPFATLWPLGLLFLALLAACLLVAGRQTPLRFIRWSVSLPPFRFTLGLIGVAMLDLLTMSSVLWALLPSGAGPSTLSYVYFLQIFMLALITGALSQVPAGLGVFETAFLMLLPAQSHTSRAVAALLTFRAIYFLAPLILATAFAAMREARRSAFIGKGSAVLGQWITNAIPQAMAVAIFVAGATLLFSGALPAAGGRLRWLSHLEGLTVIEASHFLASLAGVALLLLARGMQRRVDAAYVLSVALLAAGIVLSLAKGFDYEEAAILAVMLAALLPCRAYFHRPATLLAEAPSPGWIAATVIVLCGSAWLYAFSFKHVEYSNELWWRFAVDAEATRALRATFGAIGIAVLLCSLRLLKPARPRITSASEADISRVRPVVLNSRRTYANLVLRRDKAVLFSHGGNAFLMYQRMGRSWIALGDPIGPRAEAAELVRQFRALCDTYGGWPVFYEVGSDNIDLYLSLGLTLNKLGEEARVDLQQFDLSMPAHRDLRQARSRLARFACRFELIDRENVPLVLPELARVSNAWLAQKATREKGFSNASFDIDYLRQFPVAVVRRDGHIIAFSNVWLGAGKEEMSIDLMRHLPDAPPGTMDVLFTELMLWGQQQGYRWFNFGMAPLSGLAPHPDAPLWHRFGGLLYQYGEHFYNFQGLRHYKNKFGPVWTPRYLTSPGGIALPQVLVDVTALIAGGFTGILVR